MFICGLGKLVKLFIDLMVKKKIGRILLNCKLSLKKSKKRYLIIIRLLICITICRLYSLLTLPRTL